MAWLQAYQEEHERYPREQRIKLAPRLAELATRALAKAFDLQVCVIMKNRSSGTCWPNTFFGPEIWLPASGCSLGMVLHEVAHAYNWKRWRNRGHTGTFKNALSILYHHGRPLFRDILLTAYNQIQTERLEAQERSQRLSEKVQREATKRAAFEVERRTPTYKADKLRVRIRRLESRAKRIATILKSARRSLGVYERLAAKREEESRVVS